VEQRVRINHPRPGARELEEGCRRTRFHEIQQALAFPVHEATAVSTAPAQEVARSSAGNMFANMFGVEIFH
jgi:hypothetical protein